MRAIHKQKSKLHCTFTHSDHATSHGGQMLVDALCRRFDLWRKLDQIDTLDPRTRKTSGLAPSAAVSQFLFTLTSGGGSLADAERLGQDRVLLELIGLTKAADQTTLGEWLRAQTNDSVLCGVTRYSVERVARSSVLEDSWVADCSVDRGRGRGRPRRSLS